MEVRTWRSARSQVFFADSELAAGELDGSLSADLLSDAPSADASDSEETSEVSGAAADEVCSGVGAGAAVSADSSLFPPKAATAAQINTTANTSTMMSAATRRRL